MHSLQQFGSEVIDAFRLVGEVAPLGLVLVDPAGVILYANPWAENMFGYQKDELSGTAVEALLPPRFRAKHRKYSQSYSDAPTARAMGSRRTLPGFRKDGTEFPIGIGLSPIDGGGSILATIMDLTEVERAESAYRNLVDNAPYGIYRSDVGGRFLSVNQALVDLLGYDSADELLQVNLTEGVYVEPQDRDTLISAARPGVKQDAEAVWRRKDGSEVVVRLMGRPVVGSDGSIESFEMVAEDVTHRRQLEAQLRQAQKMEAVGELTGGLAHDFNNLLTVIVSNAEQWINASGPEAAQQPVEIREAALRGREMVRKLLGFSRHGMLNLRHVDLGEHVGAAAAMLRRLVPESISIDIDCASPTPVTVDPGTIEQIVFNLVTNARDAMPAGGMLRIETGRTVLDEGYAASHPWVTPGEYAFLAVQDTGTGMEAATLARVFEPFFTTKEHGSGTGLGLAMVFGLVKQQRGHVSIYSEPGLGTTLRVYFPISTDGPVSAAARPRENDVLVGGSETILVVEDDPAIRRATRRALESHGYRVLLAEDGEEALEVFHNRPDEIALIVSDLVMPKLGGRQLLDALRVEGARVPVVFTSGYSAPEAFADGELRDEATTLITKPWTLGELLTGVRRALDGEMNASASAS